MNANVTIDDRFILDGFHFNETNRKLRIAYHWPALLLIFVSLIGIIGNILVCIAIATERRLHNRTNWFLCSLAFADLLVSAVVIPLAIVKEFAGFWILGPLFCDLWIFFDVCSCTSSIMHIVVISIDRYFAINDPLNVRSKGKYSQIFFLIFFIWSIAILLSSPMIVLGVLNRQNILVNGQCLINNKFFVIYGSVVSFVIPLIIVLVMYTLTVRRLKQQIKHSQKHFAQEQLMSTANLLAKPFLRRNLNSSTELMLITANETRRKRLEKQTQQTSFDQFEENLSIRPPTTKHICPEKNPFYQLKCTCQSCSTISSKNPFRRTSPRTQSSAVRNERKAVKVLGVVFAIFVIAWFPFCILNLLQAICRRCSIHSNILNSFVWLGYVSSSINPLVYTIFNRNFRLKFLSLLQCQWDNQSVDRQRHMSLYGLNLHRTTNNELRRFYPPIRFRSDTVSS